MAYGTHGTALIESLNAISTITSVLGIILTGKINISAQLVFHSAHEKSHCNPSLSFLHTIFFLHSPPVLVCWCPHVAFPKAVPKQHSFLSSLFWYSQGYGNYSAIKRKRTSCETLKDLNFIVRNCMTDSMVYLYTCFFPSRRHGNLSAALGFIALWMMKK